jgi:hypothetical protein
MSTFLFSILGFIVFTGGLAGIFGITPLGMWVVRKQEAFSRWLPRQDGVETIAPGSYREATAPTFTAAGPPAVVKLAAIGSWALGQMFVPGLLLGLFGLLAMGLGLISIPGLILAATLFRLGTPLLRGEIEAAKKARSAATFAFMLNAIVVAATLAGMVLNLTSFGFGHRLVESISFGGPILLYAALSIAHGVLLRRAATEIEKNHAAQTAMDTTGVRIAPEFAHPFAAPNPLGAPPAAVDVDADAAPTTTGQSASLRS